MNSKQKQMIFDKIKKLKDHNTRLNDLIDNQDSGEDWERIEKLESIISKNIELVQWLEILISTK